MHTRLITSVSDLQSYVRELRARGRSLALVPTMGALHEGHQSLIRRAKQQCDTMLVSIFVNRTQFNSGEDFTSYPRDLEKDVEALRALNVDGIFAPPEEEIYPLEFDTFVEPGKLAAPFEGATRPGHFRGVTTIVLKLFNLLQPDVAYFGQKDFQQVQIIRRLVEDLNLSVRLVICPIVREADGLALSSRNALLSREARQAATVLHRSLSHGETLVQAGEVQAKKLLKIMRQVVEEEPQVALDYLALVNPLHLEPVERVSAGTVALIAARVGSVRLIDNLIFGPPGASPELLLQLAFAARPVIDAGARIPGLEIEALCRRIETCRDCAAMSSVMIPPREFLAKYLKRDYPDLNRVRVVVIGRDAPMNPDNYLYKHPERPTPFATALYSLLGAESFENFKQAFVLTDALRCHIQHDRVPEKALTYCARHLRDELKQFPNLQTVVTLGEDAYQQFQRDLLERKGDEIKPFEEILTAEGWAEEDVSFPLLKTGTLHVIYCYHPTMGYKHSQPLAPALPPVSA
ncbi:MAG TPA: pantoate--beta-alanine ligase [Terriglobia bacterium]|nr:pantoate--beta-alanine ligase [Terriglobia bacterium]